MGPRARAPADGGAPPRGRRGAAHGGSGARARHHHADPLRLLRRQLAAAAGRGVDADEAAGVLSRPRVHELPPAGCAARADRPAGPPVARPGPRDRGDRARDARRRPALPAPGRGLLGPLGDPRRRRHARAGRTLRRERLPAAGQPRVPLRSGDLAGRPRHPHERRAAPERLPAVRGGLRRAAVHRDAVAGLRRRRPAPGGRGVPSPRAPLRGTEPGQGPSRPASRARTAPGPAPPFRARPSSFLRETEQ